MTGFYGKVSTHGDFVSRRLPAHLVQAWDGWLQECMHASQAKLGTGWLERYLTSPVWRFGISPGILGPEGLGGVMMPSVDRVGRYFPLMLGTLGAPRLLDWFDKQGAWYDAIEDIARGSLEAGFTLECFDRAATPDFAILSRTTWNEARRFPLCQDVGPAVAAPDFEGCSLWWTEGGPFVDPAMVVCKGMPTASVYATMLDKSYHETG